MRNSALGILLFVATLAFGNWYTARSWNGTVYLYMGESRAPASVRQLSDYTPVRASALNESVHAQVMDGAAVDSANKGTFGVQLGHPLVPTNDSGSRDFACAVPGHGGVYDRVSITLYGTGVTDSGNEPHLIVDTNCQSSVNYQSLDTIWVPMAQITALPAGSGQSSLGDAQNTVVTRENIPGTWPEDWTVISVRFYRATDSDPGLVLSAAQLRASGMNLLSFNYSPTH